MDRVAQEAELLVKRYIQLVLRHRVAVLLLLAVVTTAAGVNISRGVFASSMIRLFLGNSPDYARYRELADRFSDSDLLVIAFEDRDLFTPEGWARLERITERIEDLEFVARTESVTRAWRIRGSDDELEVRTYADVVAGSGDFVRLREEVLADELVGGLLLSEDGSCVAVLIELTPDDDRPMEILPELLDRVYGIFAAAGVARDRLHPAGLVPESVEATSLAAYSIAVILPVTMLVLMALVYFLFRQLWPVILTTSIAVVSITWTFGVAILLDHQINIMMAMVPAVMVIVAFSDIIHLCSSYILELREGLAKEEAILKSGSEVGQACFFTSMTTLVGFFALAFVPTPIFRLTGIVLGVGVAIALLLALTLVPVFFSYMSTPDVTQHGQRLGMRMISKVTDACLRLATTRPWLVVTFFLALGITAFLGAMRIEIETSMVDRLDEDNPVRVSRRFVQANFAGTNFLDLYLIINDGEESGFMAAERYAALEELQKRINAIVDVDRAQSMVDLIDIMHRELGRDTDLPKTGPLLAQYLLLFEMSGGEGLERLIDEERQTARISVRLPGTGLVRTAEIGDQAAAMAVELFGPGLEVFPGGLPKLFGDWIGEVVAGQKRGLLFAFLATTLMMLWALRRLGPGLISMIPNALPLIVLGGFCGWAWDTTDSDTMLIAIIAVGIAVDDTIHFMTRLRLEALRASDIDTALRETFRFTGAAIVKTTVILIGGFLPFLTSDYYTTKIMGSMLPMTLTVALVAVLLLLPALMKIGLLRIPLGLPGVDATRAEQ